MRYLMTYEDYDPKWDYILYMENDHENWIRVDSSTREQLIQLIKGEIPSFVPKNGSKKFVAKLAQTGKRKIEKIVTFTTEEGIDDFITVKNILNKIT